MPLPELQSDLLYLIVMGPGFGESVLIRVPPNEWLVADSFTVPKRAKQRVNGPLAMLKKVSGTPSILVLTHPHEDHTAGFDRLIDFSPPHCRIACSKLTIRTVTSGSHASSAPVLTGNNESAVAAITARWEDYPESKLLLRAGEKHPLGDAEVTILHPTEEFMERCRATINPNEFSSPILVEWAGARILLGADLESHWQAAAVAHEDLHIHAAFKVAHHASKNGIDTLLFGSPPNRTRRWFATPWKMNRGLPQFEPGEGPDKILEHLDELHLTALPFKLDLPAPYPSKRTREELLEAATGGAAIGKGVALAPLGGVVPLTPVLSPDEASVSESWISAGFNREGELVVLEHGQKAVVVVQS